MERLIAFSRVIWPSAGLVLQGVAMAAATLCADGPSGQRLGLVPVEAWLAGLYSRAALDRRLAAIGQQHRLRGLAWAAGDPAIRTTLQGVARQHGSRRRQAAALTSTELKKLVAVCGGDTAGLRDRALLLVGFAGALRRMVVFANWILGDTLMELMWEWNRCRITDVQSSLAGLVLQTGSKDHSISKNKWGSSSKICDVCWPRPISVKKWVFWWPSSSWGSLVSYAEDNRGAVPSRSL
jgi:hypothetical protein